MKKVTYMADFGSPRRAYTGGFYFSEVLLKILRELPVELTVFASVCDKVDQGTNLVSGKDITEIRLPELLGSSKLQAGLSWSRQLGQALRKMPQQDLYVLDQPLVFMPLLPRAPAVVMFHGTDYVRMSDLSPFHLRSTFHNLIWNRPFLNATQRKFLTKECGIPLFNSRDTLYRLARDFGVDSKPLEKYITYLPVDTQAYSRNEEARKKIRVQYGILDDEVVIVALSNFISVKGPSRLRLIVERMLNETSIHSVKFLLVGKSGKGSGALAELEAHPRFKDMCIRVGEVSHAQVADYYSAGDIALSTSIRESFGYFIAEGMSAGLPFVAYRGGAIEEVIENGKTGFVVDNEDSFIDRLKSLVVNPTARRTMGEAGKRRVNELFSIFAFTERLKKILKEEFGL